MVPGSGLVTLGMHPSTRLLVLTLSSLCLRKKMFLSLFTPWKFCNHCLPMPSQNHSPPRRHLKILLPIKYSVLPKRNSGEDLFPISATLYFLVRARTAGGQCGWAVQGVSQQGRWARRPDRQQRPKSFSLNDKGTDEGVLKEESHGCHTLTWHPIHLPIGSVLEFPSYNRHR